MSCLHYPTDNLLRGRRRLEEIEEIVILQDWTWDDTSNRFFMRISISIDEEHPDIPQKSEWYIVSEDVYPFGSVGVYPSATTSDFSRLCEPYFQLDREECDIGELPRDGIGCWHPLFPARADDMWLAAATSIKVLEAFCMDAEHSTLTAILENKYVGGIFAGYQPVEIKYSDAQ